jgi:large conductance mechanosensitive channel
MKTITSEFVSFLQEYKIIGLAMAFVMGAATNQLVKSLVDNIFMPFITPAIPADKWQEATFSLGPVAIKWGAFLADALHFILLALIIFLVAKKIFKLEKSKI